MLFHKLNKMNGIVYLYISHNKTSLSAGMVVEVVKIKCYIFNALISRFDSLKLLKNLPVAAGMSGPKVCPGLSVNDCNGSNVGP